MSRRDQLVTIDPPPQPKAPSGINHPPGSAGWLSKLFHRAPTPTPDPEIFPITITQLTVGFFDSWIITPPINSDFRIHTITLASQFGDTSNGASQVRLALGNTVPTNRTAFNALPPIFGGISQGSGNNRGFWVGNRSDRMTWHINKRVSPNGRGIVAQFHGFPAGGMDMYLHLLISRA